MRLGVLAVLLVAPLVLASASAGAREERPWWEDTTLDADGDRLDDALVPLLSLATKQTVLVDYADMPTVDERLALARAGFVVTFAPENFPILVVQTPGARIPELLDQPGVVFVEVNDVIHPLLKESVPLTGAPQVWRTYGATGKGVVVAVLDDGAYEQHPDFQGKVAASFNAGTPSSPLGGTSPASDVVTPAGESGHGTHVAGTIVGQGGQSGGAYKGVAPDAKFVDVRVFSGPNQTSSDIVLKGLDWTLTNSKKLNIRVASMSLGGRASDGKDALSRAVDIATDKGLIVVAAAGNAGPGPKTITSPGAAEKAITVGAVDKQKKMASYSSRGPTLDGRIKPDLVAPGSIITSTVPPASTTTAGGLVGGKREVYYGALSGTSMAAPHVSGIVALMLQVDPDLTPFEVKRILLATAQDHSDKGRDNLSGYGFVNGIAAVQVTKDPTLLQSSQYRNVLASIPEPEKESLLDRAAYEAEGLVREGGPMAWASSAALVASIVIFAYVLLRR